MSSLNLGVTYSSCYPEYVTMTGTGLRERRKQETRSHLSAVATRAFIERGFDRVSIAEIARLAGVSKMTVTNYFPLKEDLVFDRSAHIIERPAGAVQTRPVDETLHACLLRVYLSDLDDGDPTLGHKGPEFSRMVAASPALRARAREISELRTAALAAAIAEEPPFTANPVAAAMAARTLAGTLEVLAAHAQDQLLAGQPETDIEAALRAAAPRLFTAAGQAIAALVG
jgi:AcrR family transcriptional regulator